MGGDEKLVGLAKEIRHGGSQQVDLGGYTQPQVEALVRAAFGAPLVAGEVVRVTLVVGGGKKVRQKYSDTLLRDVTTALSTVASYSEDRGASCVLESAGTYKFQHDTDKDLKFVHVFPAVDVEAHRQALAEQQPGGEGGTEEPLPPTRRLCKCTLEAFQKLLPRRVASFSQKRALLSRLKEAARTLATCEQKLCDMAPLEPDEQQTYDESCDIAEKTEWLQGELDKALTSGKLTAPEHAAVLEELAGKLQQLENEAAKASADGKQKRAEKLQQMHAQATAKRDAVASSAPMAAPKLKYEDDLRVLLRKLAALEKIESARGVQSLETVKLLNEKPNLEEQVAQIVETNVSSAWFAEDVVQLRIDALRQAAAKEPPQKPSGGGGGKGGRPQSGRKPPPGGYKPGNVGNAFAALAM